MKRITISALIIFAGLSSCQKQGVKEREQERLKVNLETISDIEAQPLSLQVKRLVEALNYLGHPLSQDTQSTLLNGAGSDGYAEAVQKVLDPLCLLMASINPESRVKLKQGPARPELVENGWAQFLIKVHNEAGVTAPLRVMSPNARPVNNSPADDVVNRWLEMQLFEGPPMQPNLSGLGLEYRIIQLYSRDQGKRMAEFTADVGQGTQDIGFRAKADVLFQARKSAPILLRVKDEKGRPAMAGFVIKDKWGRVYPSQAKRLAPDFSFHPQVYRADGESVHLPAGEYTIECSRGPEYLKKIERVTLDGQPRVLEFKLKRWIDPASRGWYSGDHHIHAAGCAHYANPTQGVYAKDMMRHCLGEDLKVGINLTWGPCFDYQKQFFTGQISKVSTETHLLRYDVEVSGFGSHRSGHLCLLRLKDQIYPGGDSKNHWPTLCLNTLRWAQAQGAVCGPAHSGWGLDVNTKDLPNYIIPPYSGIGANEYIVDVTHEVPGPDGKLVPAVDFMSMVDTPYIWEMNIWYHTLNCGFRTRISGETDFPCIYGQRVGIGRSYVKLDRRLDFDDWCQGVEDGRCYVSDGFSHIMDFRAENPKTMQTVEVGVSGSELQVQKGKVTFEAKVSALLGTEPDNSIRNRPYSQQPYWHIERARLGDTRNVKVELIVNGYPTESKEIPADGSLQDITFEADIAQSSWVAIRILQSSHTNPIFLRVDDKPIRASKRSAEWCLKGVDKCWSQKKGFIAEGELKDAEAAYSHARSVYTGILAECQTD
ncbi:MAG: CehA/McbA family metallohydrolase [Planctomycetota bacterium]|nr:CehA/McbA family metallohydrolase [Planctomycetota bacterium]